MTKFINRAAFTTVLLLLSSTLLSCKSKESTQCESLLQQSQVNLGTLDGLDLSQLEKMISLLSKTRQVCQEAKNDSAADDAFEAIDNLTTQVKNLKEGKISAQQLNKTRYLKELKKNGDPECPKGLAYAVQGGQRITCTGPLYATLHKGQVDSLIAEKKLKHSYQENKNVITFTLGLKQVTYFYKDENTLPQCLIATTEEKTSWQTLASQLTALSKNKLKNNQRVRIANKDTLVQEQKKGERQLVALGTCTPESIQEVLALHSNPDLYKAQPKPSLSK